VDEVGLGQTVQVLAFLMILTREYSMDGPFLIIASRDRIPQWLSTISEWTDFHS